MTEDVRSRTLLMANGRSCCIPADVSVRFLPDTMGMGVVTLTRSALVSVMYGTAKSGQS